MTEAKTEETVEEFEGIDPALFIDNISREEKARRRGEKALAKGGRK